METGKKMNICAGGATGLSGARVALMGPKVRGMGGAWAAGVAGPWAEGDNAAAPVSCLYLCSYEDIVDSCDGFFKVSGLDTDDDVELG